MIALEFAEPLEVITAYGDGYVWYMLDYGPHADTLYTIIIKETGECWQMSHKDFRVKSNMTLGIRKQYGKITNEIAGSESANGKLPLSS